MTLMPFNQRRLAFLSLSLIGLLALTGCEKRESASTPERAAVIPQEYHQDDISWQNEDYATLGFPSNLEKNAALHWIKERDLNEYGDPRGRSYAGGTPLHSEEGGGKTVKLYDYLVQNNPDKPWMNYLGHTAKQNQ